MPPSEDQDSVLTPAKRKLSSQQFQRAYKACEQCRIRKSKCELDASGEPPCTRCKRESRICGFPSERAWTKRARTEERLSISFLEEKTNFSRSDNAHPTPLGPSTSAMRRAGTQETLHAWSNNESDMNGREENKPDMSDSVMRTVISSGQDALDVLITAIEQDQSPRAGLQTRHTDLSITSGSGAMTGLIDSSAVTLSSSISHGVSEDTFRTWSNVRFIRMGWLTALEAINYVDLFFKNMAPLSPVLSDYFSKHENHHLLVTTEPLLCCTILMISSRYHTLPGNGGASRSYFIHHRLWQHCESLIMRVILGQEKGSQALTRTVGTIEAMLLMVEWNPRSLHQPPEPDGWDSALILAPAADLNLQPQKTVAERWEEEVIEPARRSDRMSWMLLGVGLTLAHELRIFGDETQSSERRLGTSIDLERRSRARKLLFVLINQFASRSGFTSMISQSLNHTVLRNTSSGHSNDVWDGFMNSWIELTKLFKSVSDLIFPSSAFTQQLLRSGRYHGMLEHFRPLLAQWRRKHLTCNDKNPGLYQGLLSIEYEYVRIYINSLGMQAACERMVEEAKHQPSRSTECLPSIIDDIDHEYVQEVISGSSEILRRITAMATQDVLRFAPVRVFLRVTTSSVFLLKAISLGVRNSQLRSTLDVLDSSIQALRTSTLDDMHLATRYATLMEMHVNRWRRNFVVSSKPSRPGNVASRRLSPEREVAAEGRMCSAPHASVDQGVEAAAMPFTGDEYSSMDNFSMEDWLAVPFDPSMAPFGPDGAQPFPPAFGDGALDFIWNLPGL